MSSCLEQGSGFRVTGIVCMTVLGGRKELERVSQTVFISILTQKKLSTLRRMLIELEVFLFAVNRTSTISTSLCAQAEMKSFAKSGSTVLQQHFERKLVGLEEEEGIGVEDRTLPRRLSGREAGTGQAFEQTMDTLFRRMIKSYDRSVVFTKFVQLLTSRVKQANTRCDLQVGETEILKEEAVAVALAAATKLVPLVWTNDKQSGFQMKLKMGQVTDLMRGVAIESLKGLQLKIYNFMMLQTTGIEMYQGYFEQTYPDG
ncbi:hypothetical protein SELMODRAFT_426858 [Selaginella moellendorffii]|uniref:Uncharacterized protein n=1 Tax=Selaginella moellendorffii TaxID=88036 RepID=D8SXQ9_SELML|nr:hypothetical protein SELMODRAFT_426858 [Selaginella moellendorffii]